MDSLQSLMKKMTEERVIEVVVEKGRKLKVMEK
jgi:hypothetical protein